MLVVVVAVAAAVVVVAGVIMLWRSTRQDSADAEEEATERDDLIDISPF